MRKQTLGTGGKHRANSPTAVRMVRMRARQLQALDYRKQGFSFQQIGAAMKLHPSRAHDYVVAAVRDMVPKETAQEVLRLELERLDQLQSAIYEDAADGHTEAIRTYLDISRHRAKLLGLYPNDKHPGVAVNIGGDVGGYQMPDAEKVGLRVEFVFPTPKDDDGEQAKIINGQELLGLPDPIGRKP